MLLSTVVAAMKYIVEFTDALDLRLKDTVAEPIVSNSPIPIPAVDDHVFVANELVRVVARQYLHADDTCHVQCFCVESTEKEIRQKCQAATKEDD